MDCKGSFSYRSSSGGIRAPWPTEPTLPKFAPIPSAPVQLYVGVVYIQRLATCECNGDVASDCQSVVFEKLRAHRSHWGMTKSYDR